MALYDLFRQGKMVCSFKGWTQGYDFIHDATERPDVSLFVIVRLIDLLRAHIVWRAHIRMSIL